MFTIATDEYLELKVNEIFLELLFDLDTIYESLNFIKEITDHNRKRIRNDYAGSKIVNLWSLNRGQNSLADHVSGELDGFVYKTMINEFSSQIDPGDQYILHAFLINDVESAIKHFTKALTIKTGDTRLTIIVNALICFTEFNSSDLLKRIEQADVKADSEAQIQFIKVLKFFKDYYEDLNSISEERIIEFLKDDILFTGVLYSLDYERKLDPSVILNALESTGHSFINILSFAYYKGLLYFEDGAYQKALKIVEETDYIKSEALYYLAFRNLHAKLLYKTGQKTEARKYWDNIIKNRFFKTEYFFVDDYLESQCYIAEIETEEGRSHTALRFMKNWKREQLEFVIETKSAQYYRIKGNLRLIENRKKKALHAYKQALKFQDDPALRDKIKKLSTVLNSPV